MRRLETNTRRNPPASVVFWILEGVCRRWSATNPHRNPSASVVFWDPREGLQEVVGNQSSSEPASQRAVLEPQRGFAGGGWKPIFIGIRKPAWCFRTPERVCRRWLETNPHRNPLASVVFWDPREGLHEDIKFHSSSESASQRGVLGPQRGLSCRY